MLKKLRRMKCFAQAEACLHILTIQNAFQSNFKTIYNALMPDMNTLDTFKTPESHYINIKINALQVN